jgi:hypothetical protein
MTSRRTSRHRIWIGDALLALELARNDHDRAQILRFLGLESAAPTDHREPGRADPGPGELPDALEEDPAPSPAAPCEPADRTDLSDLPQLQPTGFRRLPPSPSAPKLAVYHSGARRMLPYRSLLEPRSESAILRALIARKTAEGPVDLQALVRQVARCHPVLALPRRRVPTLRSGVQILVDQGTGMQPFRRDQAHIVRRVRQVLGPSLVTVGFFAATPLRGLAYGHEQMSGTCWPPRSGTRILVLSDLGLAAPDRRGSDNKGRWLAFAAVAARARCRLAVLTPYPAHRRPPWTAALNPLTWDRHTTTGQAARTQ